MANRNARPPSPPTDGEHIAPTRSRAALTAWLLLFGLVACGFTALGIWQIERLSWKQALIARVDSRVRAVAVAPPGAAQWPQVSAERDEYRHVTLHGRFLEGQDSRVQAVTALGSGWWLLTPFKRDNGEVVLVNRGWVAHDHPQPVAADPATTVTGLLRISEPGGGFLRRNDPANARWYSRDVEAIAKAHGLQQVAPYFVDASANADRANPQAPVGGLTIIQFRNHHLQYGLTWFALALMTAWAGWRMLRFHRAR